MAGLDSSFAANLQAEKIKKPEAWKVLPVGIMVSPLLRATTSLEVPDRR